MCAVTGAVGGTTFTTALVTNLDSAFVATSNPEFYNVSALTVQDKCTWVAYGALKPPVFTLKNLTVSATAKGLKTSGTLNGWVIHHMEYNDT